MSSTGLKEEVLTRIKRDPMLFGKVAEVLKIVPSSLPRLLLTNHHKLTGIAVLQTIKEHMEINGETQDIDQLTEMQAS